MEVRSEAEILATLDERGTLDGLPFMPEMRPLCGRRFRVQARADRTVVEKLGVRRMRAAVHLENVRCGGEAHDGCSRGCLIFWKEAWLRRPADSPPPGRARPLGAGPRTRDGDRYVCQATELARATRHQPAYQLGQYLRALTGENLKALDLMKAMAIYGYDLVMLRLFHGPEWNHIRGTCPGETPSYSLGLRAGERVRVRSRPEILATLDARGWNRGMEFSREMLPLCGKELTVLRRVERIIRDYNGKMVHIRNTVLLDGAVYKDLVRLASPRAEYMFWRECWLERIP